MNGLSKHAAGEAVGLLFVLSLAAGLAFVRRQRQTAYPLLPPQLFSVRSFSLAAVTSWCSFISQGLAFVVLPFLFQGEYGYSALESGLMFTPWPLTIAFAAPVAGRLADRMNPRILSTIGLVVLAAGLALLAGLGADASVADVIWRAAVCGLGFGFFQSPNNRELLGSAPRSLAGAASGVLASARTFGQAVGAAVAAIVLAAAANGYRSGDVASPATARIHLALWLACAAATIAALVSVTRIRDQ
jgi:DHA2 family multidrug resistance protein-like MFS transporter